MTTVVNGQVKACCQDAANLYLESETQKTDAAGAGTPAREVVRRCKVCGCRHYEVEVSPGRIDARGIGGRI